MSIGDSKVKSDLSKLVELQITDTRIRQLKENIETAEERRAGLEQEFEQHASSIREVQNRKAEAEAKKKTLEASVVEAKTGLERAARNLTTAQDQKQYEAAMRESDSLNKQITNFENGILEQLEIIEEAGGVLEERADEVTNLDSDWEKKQAEFEAQLRKDKRNLSSLSKERASVVEEISPNLANAYNRLISRSRDGVAVAEVVDGACSACFMSLRKQLIVQLRTTQEIMTCESCTRILYIGAEEQSEASA
jgi:predicted  nucleic acid-binding Zn-ribbon protein